MAAGMHVAQLADLEIAHPTFTAIVGLAARRLVREPRIVELTPAWRGVRPGLPAASPYQPRCQAYAAISATML